jgi:glycosyltransferase involved in cell wall biosynthesis
LKVLFVISSLAAGGAQRVIVDLGAWLVERGYDVTLLTYSDPALDHFHAPHGVKRVPLRLLWDSTGPIDMFFSNLRRLRTLRATVRGLRPDVIVSFIDITNVLTLLSTLGLQMPVIISERIHPSYHPIGLRWRLLRRLTYPLSSALVVQTEGIAAWARAAVTPVRVRIIPNPLPRRAWPLGRMREPIVLGIGRLHRQKGFDLLIDAFAKSGLPRNWRLVLVGEGPERASLAERIAELGLQDRVEMPGEVPDPQNWLARAAMFVLSSRYEGFPNVILEAMACGTPVLAFDCPTGPRDILHEGAGMVLPPEDIHALAHGIQRLANDPNRRDALAQTASESLHKFAPERINALWLNLMHSVLDRSDTGGDSRA